MLPLPRKRPDPPCESVVLGPFRTGEPCLNTPQYRFEGRWYCFRHHPVLRAETAAWRLHRLIAQVEAEGFVVRPAAASGGRDG